MTFLGDGTSNLVFYLILLAGSVAFGLESLMVGFGGKLITLYREKPWLTLALVAGLGLWVAGVSVVVGTILNLGTLYIGGLVLLLTIVSGRIVALLKPELTKSRALEAPKRISDEDIKWDLKKRGFKRAPRKRKTS